MSMPDTVLSQPAMTNNPSNHCAWVTSSIESAIRSRETSEARMPSLPIAMPSDTEIVSNSRPSAPPRTSSRAAAPRSPSRLALQGVTRFQVAATPTCGLPKSSSP
jgi:hypothetical protein